MFGYSGQRDGRWFGWHGDNLRASAVVAIALQKCQGDATYALAADNGLDRLKFGMSSKLNSDVNGAIECVVGRSSGSLAYAVGLQNSNSGARAVYNSQGGGFGEGAFDLRRRESERGGASALGEQDVQDWRGF